MIQRHWIGSTLVSFVAAWPAFGAEPRPTSTHQVRVSTDRVTSMYACDEPVTFSIQVTRGGKPTDDVRVKWTISQDGMPPLREGEAHLQGGKFAVAGKLHEPGFLQCRFDVTPRGEPLQSFRAAAAVEPTKIVPSLPPPEDFDAYWQEQRRHLDAVPLNVRLTPVKWSAEGVECFDVQADGLIGPLSGFLARPVGAKAKSLPAIVLCHAAGVYSSRLGLAAEWAKEGMVALDFNAHGLPNRKPPEFYTQLFNGDLQRYALRGRESREKSFFRELCLRLMRAIDVVCAQPEWDGRTLIAYGRSQGGGQAIVAGGLDPRVTFCAAQLPAMCDHSGFKIGRVSSWPKLVVVAEDGKYDEAVLNTARYFDAVNFAKRSKAEAIFTVGFVDLSCPPTGVYAAYNAWSGKKKILDLPALGHVADPTSEAAVRAATLKHVRERSSAAAEAAK